MKYKRFVFGASIILLINACIYIKSKNTNVSNPTKNSNSSDTLISKPDVRSSRVSSAFELQSAFSQGEAIHSDSKNKPLILSKLQNLQNSNEELIIGDTFWKTDWENPSLHKKVVYLSTFKYNEVRDQSFEKIDFSSMSGFDFAPLIIYMKNAPTWDAASFVQHYLHIPEIKGVNHKNWLEGNLNYFFMPNSYEFNYTSNIPQFYKNFPEYTLPKNKLGVSSIKIYDDSKSKALSKGYNFLLSEYTPVSQRAKYDYDRWLYDLGCPPAFSTDQDKINQWLERVNENQLVSKFKSDFIKPNLNVGYLVMDWEALRDIGGPGLYKLQACFDYWKTLSNRPILAAWHKGGFTINRMRIEGTDEAYRLSRDLRFKGSYQEWKNKYAGDSPIYIDEFYAKNFDVFQIGGYLNNPTNYGYIHHLLIQYLMNKKFFPTKKSIITWWNRQELLDGFKPSNKYFKGANGKEYFSPIKPLVFPDAMHNAAVWSFAFCDGGDLWNEPYGLHDDINFLGSNEVFTKNGTKIEGSFKQPIMSQYTLQNYQNIDRWEGGKWSVSQNKDIVENDNPWSFESSSRDGFKFSNADITQPVVSMYNKTPLTAVKLSKDNKEALCLVYDAWNAPNKESLIIVKIKEKEYKIKVFGRYTSVVRIKL